LHHGEVLPPGNNIALSRGQDKKEKFVSTHVLTSFPVDKPAEIMNSGTVQESC
jgi:hypothetical protein